MDLVQVVLELEVQVVLVLVVLAEAVLEALKGALVEVQGFEVALKNLVVALCRLYYHCLVRQVFVALLALPTTDDSHLPAPTCVFLRLFVALL